jgi:hypothetical protein
MVLAGLLASACAGPVELYEGPTRDRSEVAVIRRKGRADLTVFQIDGYPTRGFEWRVEPGPHRVWIQLVQYGTALNVRFKGWSYCSLDFEAKAGDTYQVLSESGQRHVGADTAVTLGARIVDGTGETVGWPDCSDLPPRFD